MSPRYTCIPAIGLCLIDQSDTLQCQSTKGKVIQYSTRGGDYGGGGYLIALGSIEVSCVALRVL